MSFKANPAVAKRGCTFLSSGVCGRLDVWGDWRLKVGAARETGRGMAISPRLATFQGGKGMRDRGRTRAGWSMAVLGCALAGLMGASPSVATEADKTVRIAAAPELLNSGLFDHLAPRFRFKTRVSIDLRSAAGGVATTENADLVIVAAGDGAAPHMAAGGIAATPVFARDGATFVAIPFDPARRPGARERLAKRFVSWLVSSSGERAMLGYRPDDGGGTFAKPGTVAPVRTAALAAPLDPRGEKLALRHCGRCHVVSERNKYGGIGSTPSFAALRTLGDWKDRFDAFWSLRPHPAFTQVEGITEPFAPEQPSPIVPIELTLDEVTAIVAFTGTIPPKDLGAPVQSQ